MLQYLFLFIDNKVHWFTVVHLNRILGKTFQFASVYALLTYNFMGNLSHIATWQNDTKITQMTKNIEMNEKEKSSFCIVLLHLLHSYAHLFSIHWFSLISFIWHTINFHRPIWCVIYGFEYVGKRIVWMDPVMNRLLHFISVNYFISL